MRFCEADNCNQPVWGTCKISRKGYCKRHQTLREDFDPATILQKAIKKQRQNASIKTGRELRNLVQDNPEVKAPKEYVELSEWFQERMGRLEVKCENCGATNFWLEQNKETKVGKLKWRSCQAHLMPKRHFKSLMTHPLNGMVLGSGYSGLCNCHDNYDATWEKAAKMKIWDEVVRRFLIMYPLITPEEQRFIPPQLLQEINQI